MLKNNRVVQIYIRSRERRNKEKERQRPREHEARRNTQTGFIHCPLFCQTVQVWVLGWQRKPHLLFLTVKPDTYKPSGITYVLNENILSQAVREVKGEREMLLLNYKMQLGVF